MREKEKAGAYTLVLVWMTFFGCTGRTDETAPQSTEGTASQAVTAELNGYSLGLNYNDDVKDFDTDDIDRIYNTDTRLPRWIRFIFNITNPYDKWVDTGDWPAGKGWIAKYCSAHDSGVKTALNIRWEFKNPGKLVPFVNGTCRGKGTCALYENYSKFLTTQVLPLLEDCTDVLVIGNEPFLESLQGDIKPNSNFTRFYKNIALDALQVWPYETIPFYFGSFEALWVHNPENHADEDLAREEFLDFVNGDSRISGVDLHMHGLTLDQIDKAFEWLNDGSRLANGKEIIITEFSPAPALRDDMDKNLNGAFKTKWKALDPNIATLTRNGDYLDYAIKQGPRTPAEFQEWIASLPFSGEVPHYVCDAWKKFRSHAGRFRLAFQNATQGNTRPAGYSWKWPWIITPILMPITQKPVGGQPSVRWNWYDDVQKVLKDDPRSPCP